MLLLGSIDRVAHHQTLVLRNNTTYVPCRATSFVGGFTAGTFAGLTTGHPQHAVTWVRFGASLAWEWAGNILWVGLLGF